MISTRSWKAARDHTVTLLSQRAAGTRTMASIQKAMSVATGALGPETKTMAISISQLAAVSAVSPLSDSDRFMPPMLRPGSRYRPKAHRAASQNGVSRMNTRVPPCGSASKGTMSRLTTGTSSKAPATQTASSEAATMASSSAISVVPTRSLEGRVLALQRGVRSRLAHDVARVLASECSISHVHSIGDAAQQYDGTIVYLQPRHDPTRLSKNTRHAPACSPILPANVTQEHERRGSAVVSFDYRTTSNASIEVARPPSATMSAASRRTGPSATSNCAGSSVRKRRTMMSVRTPITDSSGPVMPTSVM